jgi:hypothetical protein
MATIERQIRPWGCSEHRILIGDIVNGEFVPARNADRTFIDARKDARLSVKAVLTSGDKWGKSSSSQDVTISVPEGYDRAIALRQKGGYEFARGEGIGYSFEVLYAPTSEQEEDGSSDEDPTLSFGKYQGRKLSDVPVSYLRWLVSHAKVLKSDNRSIVASVKKALEHGFGITAKAA